MNTTFRRLSDDEVKNFFPLHFLLRWPGWKIFAVVILVSVCLRWITK